MSNLLRPTIGDNVLGQHPFLHQPTNAVEHILNSFSAAEVIMDQWQYVMLAAEKMPETLIIQRTYYKDDQNFVESGIDPEYLIASFPSQTHPNMLHQLHNEPSGYVNVSRLVDYTVACMDIARKQGKRLVVLNHGVGHPNINLIRSGVYDPILWRLVDGFHVLGQHEYWKDNPLTEPDHVGRVIEFINRARAIGIERPKIVITEAGRDIAGGQDGYRSVPIDPVEYWRLLRLQQQIYAPHGIPMCVFCLGEGGRNAEYPEGRWSTYDYQDDSYILRSMESFNAGVKLPMTTPVPLPPNTPTFKATISAPTGPVNVRNAPNTAAAQVGQVYSGPTAHIFADVAAYPDWYWIETPVFKGWINKLKGYPVPLKLEPVVTEPPTKPCPWTKEQLLAMANLHTEMSMIFAEMADQL